MNNLPPSEPFILSLPNEVLHQTFSHLYEDSLDEPLVRYYANGEEHEVGQMLVLRSICRRFRTLTAELDFWIDPDFEFMTLIRRSYYDGVASMYDNYHPDRQFLSALFSDADLVDTLGRRKTDWTFESLIVLESVLEGVPLFVQNARSLVLKIYGNDYGRNSITPRLDTAINALAACSHITKLSIPSPHAVDLSAIATNFPFLEDFSNPETGDLSGTLNPLARLRKLSVSAYESFAPTNRPWLPLRSAETLTELSFYNGGDPIPGFVDTDSLAVFLNLKSLILWPLTERLCEFIIRARIQLQTFEINLIQRHVRIDRFVRMLRADCLRNLETLDISNWHDDTSNHNSTERYWTAVFDAFTRTLPSVEEVQLTAPLHLEWCPYFARMSNLKILNWDGQTNPHFCGETWDPKGEMIKALDATFVNFVDKPKFVVHYDT
jgi:hypothetical protein